MGYKLGERFTPQHKVFDYFSYVSEQMSNVQLEKYGTTNENRPLFVSFSSVQKNMDKLEEIRLKNLSQTGIKEDLGDGDIAIVWLSYNVHGNRASATEAAINTLYKLITENKSLLENTVVIIDPCLSPDGNDHYIN